MPPTRHNLPTSGAWVELKDPTELRNGARKKATAALLGAISLDADGNRLPMQSLAAYGAATDVAEMVASMLITAWHIPYLPGAPLPSLDREIFDELVIADANRINELVEPGIRLFIPGKVDPSDHADENSPSVPASG